MHGRAAGGGTHHWHCAGRPPHGREQDLILEQRSKRIRSPGLQIPPPLAREGGDVMAHEGGRVGRPQRLEFPVVLVQGLRGFSMLRFSRDPGIVLKKEGNGAGAEECTLPKPLRIC